MLIPRVERGYAITRRRCYVALYGIRPIIPCQRLGFLARSIGTIGIRRWLLRVAIGIRLCLRFIRLIGLALSSTTPRGGIAVLMGFGYGVTKTNRKRIVSAISLGQRILICALISSAQALALLESEACHAVRKGHATERSGDGFIVELNAEAELIVFVRHSTIAALCNLEITVLALVNHDDLSFIVRLYLALCKAIVTVLGEFYLTDLHDEASGGFLFYLVPKAILAKRQVKRIRHLTIFERERRDTISKRHGTASATTATIGAVNIRRIRAPLIGIERYAELVVLGLIGTHGAIDALGYVQTTFSTRVVETCLAKSFKLACLARFYQCKTFRRFFPYGIVQSARQVGELSNISAIDTC